VVDLGPRRKLWKVVDHGPRRRLWKVVDLGPRRWCGRWWTLVHAVGCGFQMKRAMGFINSF